MKVLMDSSRFVQDGFKANQNNLNPIKHWCRQILSGLDYLHTRNPPIIHRDIKCDNIFLDATSGRVKIGDLGLAREFIADSALTVIGTPEFMAPDFYNEFYTTKVDIWGFGMSVMEMVTAKIPYSCKTAVQIYRAVTSGELPHELELITNPELLEFINLCLAMDPDKRPTAAELLAHSFLAKPGTPLKKSVDNVASPPSVRRAVEPTPPVVEPEPVHIHRNIEEGSSMVPPPAELVKENCSCNIVSRTALEIKLEIKNGNTVERIEFGIDVTEDLDAIVQEMVVEFSLPSSMVGTLRSQIQDFMDSSYEVQQHWAD